MGHSQNSSDLFLKNTGYPYRVTRQKYKVILSQGITILGLLTTKMSCSEFRIKETEIYLRKTASFVEK